MADTDDTTPDSTTRASYGRTRTFVAVALLAAAAVLGGVVVFAGPDDEAPQDRKPSAQSAAPAIDALKRLAKTSARVDVTMSFSTITPTTKTTTSVPASDVPATVPGEDTPEVRPGASDAIPLESGTIDFAKGAAVMNSGGVGVVPPTVIADGTAYLDFTNSPLGSVYGVKGWVEVPRETRVGIDTYATTASVLLDVVADPGLWLDDELISARGGTYLASIDTAALARRDDTLLETLPPALADELRAERTSGERAAAGTQMEVTVVGDDVTQVRMEIDANGMTATITWKVSDLGVDVKPTVPDEATSYEEFRAAVRAATPDRGTPASAEAPPAMEESLPEGVPPR